MHELLILKTGALGDVLRTTSILPGLAARHSDARVTWLTARGAVDLVRLHPRVAEVVAVDPSDADELERVGQGLAARPWSRVLSLDDEEALCRLASRIADPARRPGVLSGAHLDGVRRAYTPDVAPWFDMGLLSVHGKAEADRRKVQNEKSHARILADMFGIEMGETELVLPPASAEFARVFRERAGFSAGAPRIGLNTGAGGRWESKKLPVDRTVALALELHRRTRGARFLVLGGPDERARNDGILAGIRAGGAQALDGGTDNALLDFAALIGELDLLVTSDSLALHVAVARRVPVVAFFAPTSAAEIELYGRGECVRSTAPDYCSYRSDADTSTLTAARLAEAVLRWLPADRGAPSEPR